MPIEKKADEQKDRDVIAIRNIWSLPRNVRRYHFPIRENVSMPQTAGPLTALLSYIKIFAKNVVCYRYVDASTNKM